METIKQFKNESGVLSENGTFSVNIISNDEDTTSLVKSIGVNMTNPNHSCMVSIKNGNYTNYTRTFPKSEEINRFKIDEDIIVGPHYSLDISFSPEDGYSTKEPFFGVVFDELNMMTSVDTDTTKQEGVDYSVSDYTDTIEPTLVSPAAFNAYTAFSVVIGGVRRYCRSYSNNLYIHDEAGALLNTISFTATTNGICTDGTYFYGKRTASNTILQRKNLDGTDAGDITLDTSIAGLSTNQGSYFLYRNGFIYMKINAPNTNQYRINPSTGEVDVFTVLSAGSYSAGAAITSKDGVDYLIEIGDRSTNITNLDTMVTTNHTFAYATSTEYGTAAFELGEGIVVALHAETYAVIDINESIPTLTLYSTTKATNPFITAAVGNYCSCISVPYDERTNTNYPVDIDYEVFAHGVDIT